MEQPPSARDGPGHRGRRDRLRPADGPRRREADRAAVEAMRRAMDEIDVDGTIVIGEGERDEAPMLFIGEQVGDRTSAARQGTGVDIAVDPLEGTNLVAHGQANAITVLAASERGGLLHAPDTYMDKLCVGPIAAGHVDIARRRPRTSAHRRGARPEGQRHHRGDPRPAAPRRADRRGPRGRRAHQAHQRRRPLGGDQLRRLGHRRPRRDGDRRRAGGRPHRRRAALPGRRDPGPLPLPQRRGARAGAGDGPRRRRRASTAQRSSPPARTSSSPPPA